MFTLLLELFYLAVYTAGFLNVEVKIPSTCHLYVIFKSKVLCVSLWSAGRLNVAVYLLDQRCASSQPNTDVVGGLAQRPGLG